jgi:plastocyanin
MRSALLAAAAATLLFLPASAAADGAVLTAITGPGDTIALLGADGRRVTHLEPGTYTIQASDTSTRRDFTLRGPGVRLHTGFEFEGARTWTATFETGWYRYYDAAFEDSFHGQFTVGTPPPATLRARVDVTGIAFTNADGSKVTTLEPGTYSIAVSDRTANDNFRLAGPGVEEHTQVFPGAEYTWTVTLPPGRYSYFSERHTTLRGSFTVGTPPPQLSTAKRLHAVEGPDFSVALLDANNQPVRLLRPGTYTIDVEDTTDDHDFHFHGPGVDKSTTLGFVGIETWTVTLRAGFYGYRCHPHDIMFGDFQVKPMVKAKPKPKKKPKKKPKRKAPRRP